jgi:ABC-2 type transport system permease protein
MRIACLMAWSEVTRLLRIRTVLLLLIGLPLLLIFLLGNALENDIKPVKIAAYVEDTQQLGEAAKQYLSSAEIKSFASTLLRSSEEEVKTDLKSGKVDFGFVIPASAPPPQHEAGNLGEVIFYPGKYTERNMTAASILNQFLAEIEIQASSAIVVPEIREAQVSGNVQAREAISLVEVGTLVAGNNVEYGNFSALQYYAVAYLVMFLLYGGMSAALSLSEERVSGTLHRLYAMPVSINAILFGKLVGVMLFAIIQSIVLIGFTKLVYGVDWGTHYGGIALICMLISIATVGFAIIVSSFVRSQRAMESIFSLLITSMTFLSGGMIADLGQTVHEIGKYTINHWANEALRHMMAGGSLSDQWQSVVILTVIALVLLGIAATRFKKAVAL